MTNWQAGDVVANGIRIHYHRTGGGKPPVMLAHGITDNGLCWTRTARRLADDYDVVLVDARGHGQSEAPDSGYAAADHAADLLGVIEALSLETPAVVGHSMGAMSAATLAALHPGAVRGLVLEDPPWRQPNTTSPEEHAARRAQWRESLVERKRQSLETIIAAGRAQSPGWSEEEFAAWAAAKQQTSPNVFEFISEQMDQWDAFIERIECPTLLVTGDPECGAIVTPGVAMQIAARNNRIQVSHIPRAGHSIRRERYEEFIRVVTQFLAEQVFA